MFTYGIIKNINIEKIIIINLENIKYVKFFT